MVKLRIRNALETGMSWSLCDRSESVRKNRKRSIIKQLDELYRMAGSKVVQVEKTGFPKSGFAGQVRRQSRHFIFDSIFVIYAPEWTKSHARSISFRSQTCFIATLKWACPGSMEGV